MTRASSATACCRALYGHPLVELLIGESLHPGGLAGTRRLLAAASLAPGSRLLDAGCGSGASACLAAAEFNLAVSGVDVSEAAIRRASERAMRDHQVIQFRTVDLTELPYGAATFDAVLVECVLSTLPKQGALAELHRVLRRGGRLLLSDVRLAQGDNEQAWELPVGLNAALCLGGAWRSEEIEVLPAASGFRIERRWRDDGLLATFVDRIAARADLLRVMGRDLELDVAELSEGTPQRTADGALDWRRVLVDVGRAIADGRLGYFSMVAEAV